MVYVVYILYIYIGITLYICDDTWREGCGLYTHTHTHTYIYIGITLYICDDTWREGCGLYSTQTGMPTIKLC